MNGIKCKTKRVPGNELKVGDTMLFLNCPKLITGFKDYTGPFDFVERIALWNGTSSGISIEKGRYYEIID